MMETVHDEIRGVADALIGSSDDRLAAMGTALSDALAAHVMSTQTILEMFKVDKNAAMAASFDYMMQTGYLFGGWHLAASSLVAIDLLAVTRKRCSVSEKSRRLSSTYRLMPRASAHADAILSPVSQLDGYAPIGCSWGFNAEYTRSVRSEPGRERIAISISCVRFAHIALVLFQPLPALRTTRESKRQLPSPVRAGCYSSMVVAHLRKR